MKDFYKCDFCDKEVTHTSRDVQVCNEHKIAFQHKQPMFKTYEDYKRYQEQSHKVEVGEKL